MFSPTSEIFFYLRKKPTTTKKKKLKNECLWSLLIEGFTLRTRQASAESLERGPPLWSGSTVRKKRTLTLPGSHNACLQSTKQSSKLPATATNFNASAACHVHAGKVAPLNIYWQKKRLKTFRSLSFVLRAQFVKVRDGDVELITRKLGSPSDLFRGSWQIISPHVLLFIYLLFAIRSPKIPSLSDASEPFLAGPAPPKGRSRRLYMEGQEVKNWVCRVSLHLKSRLTIIEARGRIKLSDRSFMDRMGMERVGDCLSIIKRKQNSNMVHRN